MPSFRQLSPRLLYTQYSFPHRTPCTTYIIARKISGTSELIALWSSRKFEVKFTWEIEVRKGFCGLVIENRHLTARQRTGPNTCKQLIVKFHRRVKLNSRATVCNLPALWDTERSISAIRWQPVNLIASSAIRFQIQKCLIF